MCVCALWSSLEVGVQLRWIAGYDDIDECRKEVVRTGRALGGHLVCAEAEGTGHESRQVIAEKEWAKRCVQVCIGGCVCVCPRTGATTGQRTHTHIACGHLQGREDVVTRFAQAVQFVNRSTLGVHVFQL